MENEVEFERWHGKCSLSYYFEKKSFGGTNVFIRGKIPSLKEFICHLDKAYFPNENNFTERRSLEHLKILIDVLDSGKSKGSCIYFSDDRIRHIKRMDKDSGLIEGPHIGDKNFLELCHNEQYGGEYPGNPLFSSRAGMIEKVLTAIDNMKE